jgi:hypothetical protein
MYYAILYQSVMTLLLPQLPRALPALPLEQQIGRGRIVGGEEAVDGEFPFQVLAALSLQFMPSLRSPFAQSAESDSPTSAAAPS